MTTTLYKHIIDGIAPVTMADCIYMGDVDNRTLTENISIDKISEIQKIFPCCLNFKGSFSWTKGVDLTNCKKGDFWLNNSDQNTSHGFHGKIHYPNDVMYYDGENVIPLRMPKITSKPARCLHSKFDVCIIGGGAGGVGAGYALKDSGLSVCLIEKLPELGGTHCHASINTLIASPIPSFLKEVYAEAYGKYIRIDSAYGQAMKEYGEGTEYDKRWRGTLFNKNASISGNNIVVNEYWASHKYASDLSGSIDIRYNTEFVSSVTTKSSDNKDIVNCITVKDLTTGGEYKIYADYFIDCSADGYLCRYNKTEDVDFYIGTDNSTRFGEAAYPADYVANRYKINTCEGGYRGVAKTGLKGDKTMQEDLSHIKTFSDVTHKLNGGVINPPNCGYNTLSTSTGNSIDPKILIDKGYDYAYIYAYDRTLYHHKLCGLGGVYAEQAPMLGIREGYRIKCDRMLKQSDCEMTASSNNYVEQHYIALSSWYVDIHNDTTFNSVSSSYLNGIPYESLIPSAFKNVLVGSRCLGCSHIAQTNYRLSKTMMSIGYATGHAMKLAVKGGYIDDVRNIDIPTLQSNVGIAELLTEIELYRN